MDTNVFHMKIPRYRWFPIWSKNLQNIVTRGIMLRSNETYILDTKDAADSHHDTLDTNIISTFQVWTWIPLWQSATSWSEEWPQQLTFNFANIS